MPYRFSQQGSDILDAEISWMFLVPHHIYSATNHILLEGLKTQFISKVIHLK